MFSNLSPSISFIHNAIVLRFKLLPLYNKSFCRLAQKPINIHRRLYGEQASSFKIKFVTKSLTKQKNNIFAVVKLIWRVSSWIFVNCGIFLAESSSRSWLLAALLARWPELKTNTTDCSFRALDHLTSTAAKNHINAQPQSGR